MIVALYLGWTTCHGEDVAERLARDLVGRKLAACVQIESIRSAYCYQGAVKFGFEFRLCVKFKPQQSKAIESYILANHPYEIPEWVVVPVSYASQSYQAWADASLP
jgi:periplasmic divalent cation tolerance protein